MSEETKEKEEAQTARHAAEQKPQKPPVTEEDSSSAQKDAEDDPLGVPEDTVAEAPASGESSVTGPEEEAEESSLKGFFDAISRNDLDAVLPFLEKKSNLSALDEENRTPLMAAAAAGHIDLVKLFIECGANLESKGKDNRTALMHALSNGHIAVAEYLVSKGANVNIASVTNYTPLMQAAAKGALNVVRMILPKADNVNFRDMEGRTALMIAARFGHREIVDTLINRGASLLVTDNKGNTAISYAETAELKQYLTQRADEERKAAEKRAAKEKERKEESAPVEEEIKETVEEVKKRAPSLVLIVALFIVSCAGIYFAYYQFKNLKPREVSPSPAHQEGGNVLANAYCTRLAACREKTSTGFAQRCVEQSKHRFALFLSEQGGTNCNDTRLNACKSCLEGLTCDQVTRFNTDYLKKTCGSCLKACSPSPQ